jgi:hypothetical protein
MALMDEGGAASHEVKTSLFFLEMSDYTMMIEETLNALF